MKARVFNEAFSYFRLTPAVAGRESCRGAKKTLLDRNGGSIGAKKQATEGSRSAVSPTRRRANAGGEPGRGGGRAHEPRSERRTRKQRSKAQSERFQTSRNCIQVEEASTNGCRSARPRRLRPGRGAATPAHRRPATPLARLGARRVRRVVPRPHLPAHGPRRSARGREERASARRGGLVTPQY